LPGLSTRPAEVVVHEEEGRKKKQPTHTQGEWSRLGGLTSKQGATRISQINVNVQYGNARQLAAQCNSIDAKRPPATRRIGGAGANWIIASSGLRQTPNQTESHRIKQRFRAGAGGESGRPPLAVPQDDAMRCCSTCLEVDDEGTTGERSVGVAVISIAVEQPPCGGDHCSLITSLMRPLSLPYCIVATPKGKTVYLNLAKRPSGVLRMHRSRSNELWPPTTPSGNIDRPTQPLGVFVPTAA